MKKMNYNFYAIIIAISISIISLMASSYVIMVDYNENLTVKQILMFESIGNKMIDDQKRDSGTIVYS